MTRTRSLMGRPFAGSLTPNTCTRLSISHCSSVGGTPSNARDHLEREAHRELVDQVELGPIGEAVEQGTGVRLAHVGRPSARPSAA